MNQCIAIEFGSGPGIIVTYGTLSLKGRDSERRDDFLWLLLCILLIFWERRRSDG
jgi:hypothetical protein